MEILLEENLAVVGSKLPDDLLIWKNELLQLTYTDIFNLNPSDMEWILRDATYTKVIQEIRQSYHSPKEFDKNLCLALLAVSWVIKEKFKEKNSGLQNREISAEPTKKVFPDLSILRKELSWEEIAERTRTAIGDHPLADLIHNPVREPLVGPRAKIIVNEGESTIIGNKLSVLDEGKIVLEKINMSVLDDHIKFLPPGSIDTINPSRHQIDPALIKTSMAIAAFNEDKLNGFDPYTDEYEVYVVKNSLKTAWKYLRDCNLKDANQIINLWQLFESIKNAAIKAELDENRASQKKKV